MYNGENVQMQERLSPDKMESLFLPPKTDSATKKGNLNIFFKFVRNQL